MPASPARAGPGELYAIYLLRAGQRRGLGRALFEAVRPEGPFTCCVVAGNEGACTVYAALGGRPIASRPERIGSAAIEERVFGWRTPHADGGAPRR